MTKIWCTYLILAKLYFKWNARIHIYSLTFILMVSTLCLCFYTKPKWKYRRNRTTFNTLTFHMKVYRLLGGLLRQWKNCKCSKPLAVSWPWVLFRIIRPCHWKVECFCWKGEVWIQLKKIQYFNANLRWLHCQIGKVNSVIKTHQHVFSLISKYWSSLKVFKNSLADFSTLFITAHNVLLI